MDSGTRHSYFGLPPADCIYCKASGCEELFENLSSIRPEIRVQLEVNTAELIAKKLDTGARRKPQADSGPWPQPRFDT